MKFNCSKCKIKIILEEQKVEYKKRKRFIRCPKCNMKYEVFKMASGYKRMEDGSLRKIIK